MSTKVIKQYLDEGVLNYVEHATPRHYFLYDGVMEEQNADVHRLVEDLCDENMELQKRIKEYDVLVRELFRLLDITEQTDEGRYFRPNKITSCRAMDAEKLEQVLKDLKNVLEDRG